MVAEIKSEMLFTARNTNIILENAKNKSMIQIIQLKHLKQVGVKYIEYLHTVLSEKKDFPRSLYIFLITENGWGAINQIYSFIISLFENKNWSESDRLSIIGKLH